MTLLTMVMHRPVFVILSLVVFTIGGFTTTAVPKHKHQKAPPSVVTVNTTDRDWFVFDVKPDVSLGSDDDQSFYTIPVPFTPGRCPPEFEQRLLAEINRHRAAFNMRPWRFTPASTAKVIAGLTAVFNVPYWNDAVPILRRMGLDGAYQYRPNVHETVAELKLYYDVAIDWDGQRSPSEWFITNGTFGYDNVVGVACGSQVARDANGPLTLGSVLLGHVATSAAANTLPVPYKLGPCPVRLERALLAQFNRHLMDLDLRRRRTSNSARRVLTEALAAVVNIDDTDEESLTRAYRDAGLNGAIRAQISVARGAPSVGLDLDACLGWNGQTDPGNWWASAELAPNFRGVRSSGVVGVACDARVMRGGDSDDQLMATVLVGYLAKRKNR